MTKGYTFRKFLLVGFLVAQMLGCAAPKSREAREISQGVNQAELQQDVQRFVSVLIDRVAQSMDQLVQSNTPKVREEGLRRALVYTSYALDIASEAAPELSLLDMIVFITLCRDALEKYWIPKVFKDEGHAMLVTFDRAEREIWAIGAKVMTAQQQNRLKSFIARWQAENTDSYRVEGVRFGEFSRYAGKMARDRAEESGGFLSSVASGVETADQALLTADRVLFLAQRMPFLIRMHAVLGASEAVASVSNRFDLEDSLRGSVRGAMKDSLSLAGLAGQVAREGRQLVEAMYPLVLPRGQIGENLAAANHLASTTVTILDRIASWKSVATGELNRFMTQIALLVLSIAVLIVAAWWSGYYFVKRRLFMLSLEKELQKNMDRHSSKAS
jgi:hypothetical protein